MTKRNLSQQVELIVADLWFSERARRAITCEIHVHAAAEYIMSHIGDPFVLDDIAVNLSLNRCYLSRMFKKKTGICLSKFARRVKVLHATHLLRENLCNVSAAAAKAGFRDLSTFRRNFKLFTDSSPSAYRGASHRNADRTVRQDLLLSDAHKRLLG